MDNNLCVHDIVIFNRIKSGNANLYKATNLKNCFFFKNCSASDGQAGVSLASVGTCVIPLTSLPEKAFVPPLEWQAVDLDTALSQQLVTLNIDDIIAKGIASDKVMSAKDIMSSFDTITIHSISVDDFSSNKSYLLKGV